MVDCTVQLMEENNGKTTGASKQRLPGAPLRQQQSPIPVIWNPDVPGLYVGLLGPDKRR